MARLVVDDSDLMKLRDTLQRNLRFHERRDEMNGELHLAERVRYSPLTVETDGAVDRVKTMLEESPLADED